MRYITSDVHGCKEPLDKLLNYIGFNNNDELIVIGDSIDRGPESAKLVDWVINSPNIHLIFGNHESSFCDVYENINLTRVIDFRDSRELKEDMNFQLWLDNGGKDTCISFNEFNINNPSRNLYNEFYDYLRKCSKYMIIDKYILVHAGTSFLRYEKINTSELIEWLDNLNNETLLWDRRFFDRSFNRGFCQSLTNFTTIIGHTPVYNNKNYTGAITKDIIIKHYPKNNSTVIALDLGVNETDMLGLLSLDTLRFFYINKNEVQYIDLV